MRLFLVAVLCLVSCETTVELKRIGEACAEASECGKGLCFHGRCTAQCSSQGQCPVGFDCGLQDLADVGAGLGASCYAPNYAPMTGGFGTSCALVSADP